MSLERLRSEIATFTVGPYLLTVSDDERPHCVAVSVAWTADELVMAVGNTSRANATARRRVSLLWPPDEPGGYSLIVDATVTVTPGASSADASLTVRPTRAVLHRPAEARDADRDGCTSDCVPIPLTATE